MTQDQIMELVDDYAMAQYDLAFVDEHGDGKRNEARAAVVAAIDALTKDAARYQYPASQTKPLTNEQINDLMQEADAKWSDADVHMHWARHFARAIEAANGVKP